MKKSTARKVIKQKVDEWLLSVKDETLRELVRPCVVVSGGCITSLLIKEKVNDYDIYLSDIVVARKLTAYYCKEFTQLNPKKISPESYFVDVNEIMEFQKGYNNAERDHVCCYIPSKGFESEDNGDEGEYKFFERESDPNLASEYIDNQSKPVVDDNREAYRPIFLTSNAITLSNDIQIILRFVGDAEKIHTYFDFSHCKCYWTYKDSVVVNQDALECMLSKTLKYSGSKFPLCSIFRTKKFLSRGWSISVSEYLKMCLQLQEFDLRDITVLRAQCTGCDLHYFQEMLTLLSANENGRDSKGRLDICYLTSIIEKVFV